MKFDKNVFRKFFLISTMLALCFTLYKITKTYALLQSETQSSIVQEIGKWNIKINEIDITDGVSKQVVINNFSIDANDNVKEGKIAPGATGNLELTLDPVDTDVSVRFDVSFTPITEEQIKLASIEKIDGEGVLVKTDENTYSGIMKLSEITNKTAKAVIKITVIWENNEECNESDTIIGTTRGYNLQIPINIKVSQYLGETLEEYKD